MQLQTLRSVWLILLLAEVVKNSRGCSLLKVWKEKKRKERNEYHQHCFLL